MNNSNTNVFETPVYSIKDFGNKEALEAHLNFKINAVKEAHEWIWNITNVDKNVTETTASAKIHMTRKKVIS